MYMYMHAHSTACVSDEILSANRSLLPLSSITATTEMSDDPARDVVHENGASWCTGESFREGDAPYIMFEFTDRVMLTYMRARGATIFGASYVTEFSLDYREKDTQSFTPYTLLTNEEAVSEYVNNHLFYLLHSLSCSQWKVWNDSIISTFLPPPPFSLLGKISSSL